MKRYLCVTLSALACTVFGISMPAWAEQTFVRPAQFKPGDCVIFREGGDGWVLKGPSYWLKGTVTELSSVQKMARVCPAINKPEHTYSHEDWIVMVNASPCVDRKEDERKVSVPYLSVRVDDWDTPWTRAHGQSGWLFRGYFLDRKLHEGELVQMSPAWVEPCSR